jgi:hypothetical protein
MLAGHDDRWQAWTVVDHGGPDTGQVAIDPATNTIDRVLVSATQRGGDIVVIGDSVWVLDGSNNRILRMPLSAFGP